jgi:hypothetical protein
VARPPFATCKLCGARASESGIDLKPLPCLVTFAGVTTPCAYAPSCGSEEFFLLLLLSSFWDGVSGGCARECENVGERYAAWWNLALFEVPYVMRTGMNDQSFQSGFSFRSFFFFWFCFWQPWRTLPTPLVYVGGLVFVS